jgi:putative DNA primase/helicase
MQKPVTEHLSPEQFAELMAVDVEARRKGGPNLQHKYLALVERLPQELHRHYKAATIKCWSDLEIEIAKPAPMVWHNGRRYPAEAVLALKGEASFFKPKPQPEADPEPEVAPGEEPHYKEEAPDPAEDQEAAYVEDDTNAANDIRRRLWRLHTALPFIEPTDKNIQVVGGVLWRLSERDRTQGEVIWVKWLIDKKYDKDKARAYWDEGFDKATFYPVEVIYRSAQLAGWRFPISRNLNKLEEMVERTEKALVRAGAEIYQNLDRLVRPVRVKVLAAPPAGSTKTRTTTVATLAKISEPWLKSATTRYVDFFEWKREQRAGIGVPPDVAKAMLSRFGLWEFPTVTGVITSPTLRPDGTILAKEGWDSETGLLLFGPLPVMPLIADEPTKDDARKAIAILDSLLTEFPFVDRGSRSASLSALITPVVRGALKCVPGHSTSSPEPGTGKSYLGDLASGIASGDAMPILGTGKGEELDKRIDAQVLAGIPLWCLDNVTTPIGGDAICQAIERPLYGARILSKSEVKTVRNTWSIFINGNALKIKNDATRRILRISLDAKQEKPEYRKFKSNPYLDVLRDRGRYLWAALTVVRAYIVAGKPNRLPWIGEPFSAWSDLVRSALVWLDYEDPFVTTEATRDNDPDRQSRAAMLQSILLAYGDDVKQARTANEMIEDGKRGSILPIGATSTMEARDLDNAKCLMVAIEDYLGGRGINAQHLGNKFGKDQGRITDGLKLCTSYDKKNKVNFWYVEKVNAPE